MSVFLDGSDDDFHGCELAVDAQAEQHQEEDDRPNLTEYWYTDAYSLSICGKWGGGRIS